MRRFDKKKHIANANILAEQRHVAKNSLIREYGEENQSSSNRDTQHVKAPHPTEGAELTMNSWDFNADHLKQFIGETILGKYILDIKIESTRKVLLFLGATPQDKKPNAFLVYWQKDKVWMLDDETSHGQFEEDFDSSPEDKSKMQIIGNAASSHLEKLRQEYKEKQTS
jgi:hypothetical protein